MAGHHPSNTLYRGEARDFEHAMDLVIAECQFEQFYLDDADKETRDLNANLEAYKAAARKCLAEYYARIRTAEDALAEEWRRSSDEDVRRIGEALLERDYSALAI